MALRLPVDFIHQVRYSIIPRDSHVPNSLGLDQQINSTLSLSTQVYYYSFSHNSDENEISLYIITTSSNNQVMRTKKSDHH